MGGKQATRCSILYVAARPGAALDPLDGGGLSTLSCADHRPTCHQIPLEMPSNIDDGELATRIGRRPLEVHP